MKTTFKILSFWALSGILGLHLIYEAVKYTDSRVTGPKTRHAYLAFGGPAALFLGTAAWIGIGLGKLERLYDESKD